MIRKEWPYIDAKGKAHKNLIKIYSDLGVRLLQEDTGNTYEDFVIDSIYVQHIYTELSGDLGELPDDMKEETPKEDNIEA